ncbi:MAG TPA: hypothetical protein DCP02_06025 [Actinobacteria bacterium]|nr:hypothetical protein [Actinomycetota bacterium]
MKKNKLYILISIVTLICFLGTAALCNQAGGGDEVPTIKLKISDGPIFSEEDQVCYYEIEAIVTGTPEPDIEFTLDNNVSLLATEKAKVILNDSSDSYTLEATAINNEGSAQASINLSWGCEEEVAEEATEDEEETVEEGEDSEESEEESQEGEVLEGDLFSPELSIFIYEGPIYSSADNVYYYRIASEMYGNPYPDLTWSKDDSNDAFGYDKVQVNLREGERYTLTATATNTEGTITRSLDLEWGCDDEEVSDAEDGDGEDGGQVGPLSLNVDLVSGETTGIMGILSNGQPNYTNEIVIGDDLDNVTHKGFISFNITPLAGATITEAILTMSIVNSAGDLSEFNNFYIGSMHWGERLPNTTDFNATVSAKIIELSSSGDGNIVCSNNTLKTEIQKAIDSDWSRFQAKAYFSGSSNDNSNDWWHYKKSGVTLKVKYIP